MCVIAGLFRLALCDRNVRARDERVAAGTIPARHVTVVIDPSACSDEIAASQQCLGHRSELRSTRLVAERCIASRLRRPLWQRWRHRRTRRRGRKSRIMASSWNPPMLAVSFDELIALFLPLPTTFPAKAYAVHRPALAISVNIRSFAACASSSRDVSTSRALGDVALGHQRHALPDPAKPGHEAVTDRVRDVAALLGRQPRCGGCPATFVATAR